ncbi:hypothetical protein ABK040_006283 [Willaertia magna]
MNNSAFAKLYSGSSSQDITSTNSTSGQSTSTNTTDIVTFDVTKPFPSKLLTQEEGEGVAKTTQKLQEYQKVLEEMGKLLQEVGYTGNMEADAQNLVCVDRHKFLNFGLVINKSPRQERKTATRPAAMNVKLILSLLGENDKLFSFGLFRRVAAGIANTEFGLTHASLLIGQWRIDWYNSSIVSIRSNESQIFAKNSIAAMDLGNLRSVQEIENAFNQISKIACEYNATKVYDRKKCNCHHFVKDIMKALNLQIPEKGPFKQYFKALKKGETRRLYKYSATLKGLVKTKVGFQDKYQQYYKTDEIEFTERKQVDDFAWWLNSLDYFNTEDGKLDFPLLKGFDRSFVMNRQNEGLSIGIGDENEEKCFFSFTGKFQDDSINRIQYNVQKYRVPPPNRK